MITLHINNKMLFVIGLCISLIACDGSSVEKVNKNNPPVIISSANISIAENSTIISTIDVSDADGDTLSFSLSSGIDQSLFALNTSGILSFINSPDFENPTDSDSNNIYLVQIEVSDGKNAIQQTISVHVTNTNEFSPVFSAVLTTSILENTSYVITLTANDGDGDDLNYSLLSGDDKDLFKINSNTGVIAFNSTPDYETPTDSDHNNSYLIQVSVSDGELTVSQALTVNVIDIVNEFAPIFTSTNAFTVAENTTAVGIVAAIDPDGGIVSFNISGGADQAHFNIDSSSSALVFNNAPDYESPTDSDSNNSYVVQIAANDGVDTTNQTISIMVSNQNDNSPVITSGNSFSIAENSIAVATITAIDDDANTLSFTLTGGADQLQFSVNSSNGALVFNTAANYEMPADSDGNNTYIVQVTTSDGVNTTNQTISITVTNVNDVAPVFTSGNAFAVAENTIAVGIVAASDPDGGIVSFNISGGTDQAHFNIDSSSGALIFNNAPDYELPADNDGNNSYILQVSADDGVHTINQTITVNVSDLNESNYGLTSRPLNISCSIPQPPATSSLLALTRAFSSLSFNKPVALRQSPTNTDRWYVLEQEGVIRTFLSGDSSSTVFANLTGPVSYYGEMGLLGIAFHPDFVSNGYIYLYYSGNDNGAPTHHESRISRFTLTSETQLDISSEQVILRVGQPYDNHNGGNILFGPDGYLYIGLGDGGNGGDPNNNAQNINTLLGKMLRIDVDNPAGGNQYSSPATNPYVGISGLDEIFAIGLRNPWRWSFDRTGGQLIAGDVGQGSWEEIDIITNDGNYGWRCYEGNEVFDSSCSITQTPPIHAYDHSVGFSVTGGYVYRGSAIPSLVGSYVFSDYGTGPIWVMTDPYGTPSVNELISNSTTNATFASSFAEDNNGELYVLSFTDGSIYRIEPDTGIPSGSFPTLLSETGCVNPADPTQMAQGMIPYEINAPFWSDGIVKDRWFAVPDGSTITVENNGDWSFPNNSVTVKNFRLNNKLIETRLLVKHDDGSWAGYSYEWNDAETDASLVLNGKSKDINGQSYIYPSSAQCMFCHTQVSGFALGPETRQLNRDKTYASTGINANQLSTLNHIGIFSQPLDDPAALPKLAEPTNTSASLQDRARAYLYTNCAQCHRQGGPTNVALEFNITTVNADMNVCNVAPSYNINGANYILSPGNASDSSLYHRMNCRTGNTDCYADDQMPPIGSAIVDSTGANLLSDWINSLSNCQ